MAGGTRLLSQTWVAVVGALLGAVTLFFLMGLVVLSVFGLQVQCESRYLVPAVIAFGAGLSAAFLGGNASARGTLPIPGLASNPLAVSVGGGVAVLVIMFVLLTTLYPTPACDADDLSADASFGALILLAEMPNPEKRAEVYSHICRCEPSEEAIRLISMLHAEPLTPEAEEAVAADIQTAALSDVQGILSSYDRPACGGDFRFALKDELLYCASGEAIPFLETANRGAQLATLSLVVLHSTGTTGFADVASLMASPTSQISAHFLISRAGAIIQLVPTDLRAWHAGSSSWGALTGLNSHSIGVELVNAGEVIRRSDGFTTIMGQQVPESDVVEVDGRLYQRFTATQLEAARSLIAAIYEAEGQLPVLRHSDVSPGRRTDPGPVFPMDEFCAGFDCPVLEAGASAI